ncbi:hypothetical protein SLNSH_19255 [Alsobacter soli]|uniref:Uncharacterized protein n=1 Tax=Alsobacter soli TaxID=2109933 RepID=A0A2T1HP12_9HYPH|nr:hypothetical protein [Alsobacter soli]PSC03405.1 hypothetical protein SLNSH_19255 [Alsobacter soli]
MKAIILASAVLAASAGVSFAQDFSIGPGGVRIERHGDRDWREHRRWGYETGSVSGCRTITVQRRNEDGDLITKRIRRCD